MKSLNEDGKNTLSKIYKDLKILNEWNEENLQSVIETFIEREEIGFGKVAQPMRSALTGNNVSPGISEVLEWLGKTESLGRINDQI
jgi:glutamyl-tRNA synthetase